MKNNYSNANKKPLKDLTNQDREEMSQFLKKNGEYKADEYAKKDDINSLHMAFGNYYAIGIGYKMIDSNKDLERVTKKGKDVVDRLVTKTGLSRKKVLVDLFDEIAKAIPQAIKMVKEKGTSKKV